MEEKKYTDDGFLIVAETGECPHWEKDSFPCYVGVSKDCFFCKYSDFRTPEFIRKTEETHTKSKLHSICRNEKNKKIIQKNIMEEKPK